ncbi:hypothetical protein FA95DRAFT_1610463 [Auriscalpium vulgare]|uniref:Uncharacterized protein n=1 Tax=Auriscalpium vulgare TaxID=40419 RepID=A0ACB8RDQ7_9AGAM|nr:hypothetical protein FA95DRAFT_1610463 [Auriscalpium vulgare]
MPGSESDRPACEKELEYFDSQNARGARPDGYGTPAHNARIASQSLSSPLQLRPAAFSLLPGDYVRACVLALPLELRHPPPPIPKSRPRPEAPKQKQKPRAHPPGTTSPSSSDEIAVA